MAQINKPNLHFNSITWTGSGNSSRSFTGVGFAPDFVWVKNRGGSTAIAHSLYDKVRGAGANKELVSNATTAEGGENHDSYDYLSSFDSDGFSSTYAGNTAYYFNESGSNYIGWNWKAGGSTGSANSDGSLASTVSANTTAGFSIVKYVATSSDNTVGHGLGATPKMIITKSMTHSSNWSIYHNKLASGSDSYIEFTTSQATNLSLSPDYWGTPSNTTFGIKGGYGNSVNGNTYIAYCFAEKKGFSHFGYMASTNNADGAFVYTGFAPAFVMLKKYNGTAQWVMYDRKRPGYNQTSRALFANSNVVEATDLGVDLLSNGFKIRATNNQNTGEYITMAFAENPIVGSNNIPATAR